MKLTPAYEQEGVTLYHGDCLDLLPELTGVDAVVTDPPYNVGYAYHDHDDRMLDYREWCGRWFAESRRLTEGPIGISSGIVNVAMWCGIEPPDWILCWHKPACMGRSPTGVNNWEPVLLYGKSPNRGVNDVIRAPIKVRDDIGDHPCPKPLGWGLGLVNALTKPDALVLDPFAGSGTTGVACLKTGRRAILIEKDARYIPTIIRRLQSAETPLFSTAAHAEVAKDGPRADSADLVQEPAAVNPCPATTLGGPKSGDSGRPFDEVRPG
jgi:site-specific DNA-methyltransferase (adenine-specific)